MVRWLCFLLTVLLAVPAGCSRTRYRLAADRDTLSALQQKSAGSPWQLPADFALHAPPTSRLHDPTPIDDPWLPMPAPQLYVYDLPELPPHSIRPRRPVSPVTPPAEPLPPPVQSDDDSMARLQRLPAVYPDLNLRPVAQASHVQPVSLAPAPIVTAPLDSRIRPVAFRQNPGTSPAESAATRRAREGQESMLDTRSNEVLLNPIPEDVWQAVPETCRARMLEFKKLRDEYERSFGSPPSPDQLAPGQRLSLEDIVFLTLLNSREYQTQKEVLYRVSLRLSLERFAYQLKFSPFNNGTAVDWRHTRNAGITENRLNVPTNFQVEKMLATGGDLVARFANNVVLTFNGPTGFAADVGSDIFLDLNQTVFQNDVRFESLTQAERDVVYAARDFMRFRKSLFVQLASQYYNLIRTYRQVEIDSQNYFTLVRAFRQTTFEYRAGFLPRFQLDQVEQNVLSGRSRLIATCNNLEAALDNLKIRIGLPTETPINIDMSELDQLTAHDELAVTGQLIRRARQRLLEEQTRQDRTQEAPNRLVLLSSSIVLLERMLVLIRLQEELGEASELRDSLTEELSRLRVAAFRENAEVVRSLLADATKNQEQSLPIVFQRTMDLIEALLELIERQLEYARSQALSDEALMPANQQLAQFRRSASELLKQLDTLIDEDRLNELPELVRQSGMLQSEVEALVRELDRLLGIPGERREPAEELRQTLEQAGRLLDTSDQLLQQLGGGLSPVQIAVDDAMLTALNLRFDLMNQRGDLADVWRDIKYAGDDLKSVLNLSASHRLSTRQDVNRVFDFTFDDSETRVRASLDAPFNRRAERNNYRLALINYQAGLRQLMLLEDNIKLGVRNDLRNLALGKEQFEIEVASAALAYERVISVLLELRLGIGRVAARDFLEAQNAYASALSNVASRHIGYIVDRTQLFLDLELLTVGEDGFWQELYDEEFQPVPFYQLPDYATPVYGELVPGLWYSKALRRLEQVPPGTSGVWSGEN